MIKMKKFEFVCFLVFIFVLFLILISYFKHSYYKLSTNTTNHEFFSDNWTIQKEKKTIQDVSLPYIFDDITSYTHIVSREIPSSFIGFNCIAFQNYNQIVKVYIDNELIYSFGEGMPNEFPIPANLWHFISIDEEDSGKQVKFEFYSPLEQYAKVIPKIILGEKSAIMLQIIKRDLLGIIPSFLLLGLAIFLFIAWMGIRKSFRINRLLYLSLFTFHLLLWSLTETQMLQFFLKVPRIISALSIETLMLASYPILLYFRDSSKKEVRTASNYLLLLLCVHFILMNLLNLTGILILESSLVYTHFIIILSSVVIVIAHLKATMHKKNYALLRVNNIGFIILTITCIIDMYRYYSYQLYDYARFTRFGFLIYIMILGIDSFKYSLDMISLGHKAKVYEHLAYHDILTGYYNRNAYEEYIKKISEEPSNWSNNIFFNIDLNNLKTINDNEGHDAGDLYIIQNINFIMDFFSKIGSCYRVGGDEFILIIQDTDYNVFLECLNRLQFRLQELSKNLSISFAYGYAKYDPKIDKNIQDTMKRADDEMYQRKVKMKGLSH